MKPGGRLVIHDCMYEDEEWRKIFTDLDSLKSYLEKIRLPKEGMDFVLGLTQSSTGIIRTFREEYVESVI